MSTPSSFAHADLFVCCSTSILGETESPLHVTQTLDSKLLIIVSGEPKSGDFCDDLRQTT